MRSEFLLRHLALQYTRFGAVGLTATGTHVFVFTSSIEVAGLAPLVANLAAFGVAVLVSFLGHFHWTFRGEKAIRQPPPGVALVRFVMVAFTGLGLNSLAVYVTVNLLSLPYPYAIVLMITIVPLVVFGLSKFWVFG
ncbi:MAG: GtrA family protein [Rhodospirillales bacterium]|nr:GtrA family protein [Rhodospirillales bacterium]